ncbi:MAG TPA: D-alanyl-D-alanine carboxypeptidase family protein [Candidatus Avimonas sp.]|nr:D-alanyl-D-alanine carboxypeptidase [Clostridiales bacterium]HPU58496.1 D-alanyl-D-alanine carboxypeptidase family protein [Candidatus Avimonas sp.]
MNRNPRYTSNSKNVKKRRKNKSFARKRIAALTLLVLCVGLVVFLGWQVAHNISRAIATGDQPDPQLSKTTEPPATTTTHPTISVSATLASPRILVYDATHSAVLYSQNPDEKCYPASLTKLLTAIIATEECTPDEIFTVGSEQSFVNANSSRAYIYKGYKLTRDMIIDALLLPSGNDAAYTIAAHVGRKLLNNPEASDIEALFAFADKMNEKAKEFGAVNSHFSNPDGYFAEDHYTTASDMLKIALAAMKYDNIRQSVAKKSVTYTLPSGQNITFRNTNLLINPNSNYYFEGATGLKTGSTDESGYCVVATAQRDGVEIVAVVMGGPTDGDRWKDTIAVLNQAFAIHQTQPAN